MEKMDLKTLYVRTWNFLINPETEWNLVKQEEVPLKNLFKFYLVPIAGVSSVAVLLGSLLFYSPMQAIGYAIINLLSATIGTWFTYLLTREYLCNKIEDADNTALYLTVYSAALFIIFHSLSIALGYSFLSQLFTVASFIFVRTLYTGLNQLKNLQANYKTNILIITGLSIVCLPVILQHILMIVFRISAFNI